MSEHTHIRSVQMWDSGGGVEVEVVELTDDLVLAITDEVVTVYPSAEAFWEGDDTFQTVGILRETGKPMVFDRA